MPKFVLFDWKVNQYHRARKSKQGTEGGNECIVKLIRDMNAAIFAEFWWGVLGKDIIHCSSYPEGMKFV